MAGLAFFHESLQQLRADLDNEPSVRLEDYDRRAPISKLAASPEVIVNITLTVFLSGAATAVYRLLKQWVELKNGRKIKIRVKDVEIEATQLSPEQFLALVKALDINKAIEESKGMSEEAAREMFSKYLNRTTWTAGHQAGPKGSI